MSTPYGPHKHIPIEGGHLTVSPDASPELVNALLEMVKLAKNMSTKSKEECLAKNIGTVDPEDLQLEITLNPSLENILAAMDEYARQTAIGFAEWKDKNYNQSYATNSEGAPLFYRNRGLGAERYTIEQLFALYLIHLQSLNK